MPPRSAGALRLNLQYAGLERFPVIVAQRNCQRPRQYSARLFRFNDRVQVLEENDGDARLIAVHDETGGFVGGVHVDHAAELQFATGRLATLPLIGDDAYRRAAEPAVSAYQRRAKFRLVFVERTRI